MQPAETKGAKEKPFTGSKEFMMHDLHGSGLSCQKREASPDGEPPSKLCMFNLT
jgi:hypothetical protein